MKRVYAVFETRHGKEDDPFFSHDDKFIDVYDNFTAAIESIHLWADSYDNLINRVSDRATESLIVLDKISPYSNEDKIYLQRVVKSTLLKSS